MAATASLKESPYVKEWMVQADPPKDSGMFKKMNGQLQLLPSNKMIHYFKKWTTPCGILKRM